jgi:hypothetical protein
LYVAYFGYNKCLYLWGCKINVPNIVFKHFLLFNKGKLRYFKDLRGTQHCHIRPTRSFCNYILPLALQNTLTKTSVQHFPITYEAVTDTFMLGINYRTNPPPSSRPHTSIDWRYTTICKFVKFKMVL